MDNLIAQLLYSFILSYSKPFQSSIFPSNFTVVAIQITLTSLVFISSKSWVAIKIVILFSVCNLSNIYNIDKNEMLKQLKDINKEDIIKDIINMTNKNKDKDNNEDDD